MVDLNPAGAIDYIPSGSHEISEPLRQLWTAVSQGGKMSLTTFLDNKDIRAKFSEEFPKPKFVLKKQILAPPVTRHYKLVGTAFDYLMRFYIKWLNPEAIAQKWVAESAVRRFIFTRSDGIEIDAQTHEINMDEAFMSEDDTQLLKKFEDIISVAKTNYSEYLESGVMTDELIRSAILLAQLDFIYRAGIVDESIGIIDDGDVADLRKLLSIVNPESFRAKGLCLLNPTFGEASRLVGGADADLVIDNVLIDIKTTTKLEFKTEHFNQLIGYYTLCKLGGIPDAPVEPKIENLGIYYSRFGELYTFPVIAVIQPNKFLSFIEWFKEEAIKRNERNRRPGGGRSPKSG